MIDGLERWRGQLLSVFRIALALMLLQHATQKIFGFPSAFPFGPVQPLSMIGVAAAIEAVAGLLVLVGLWTRPASFILSGELAVAYFIAHATRGFYPIVNGGELAVIYCFGFLYLSAAGAGPWSVDGVRAAGKRRTAAA